MEISTNSDIVSLLQSATFLVGKSVSGSEAKTTERIEQPRYKFESYGNSFLSHRIKKND